MTQPKTPDEALAAVQHTAASGDVRFASADTAKLYKSEIDEIMTAIYEALGRKNKGRYFISDRSHVSDMLSDEPEERERQSSYIAAKLGVGCDGNVVEMAQSLRASRMG